jgi:hypothetical protein
MSCEAAPGTRAGRMIDKAWREGRVIPMNDAARRNAEVVYTRLGIDPATIPGMRPAKVSKRK